MLVRVARPALCLALAACHTDPLVCRGRPVVDPPIETFEFPDQVIPVGDLNGDGIADLVLQDFDFQGEEDTTLARVVLGPIDENWEPVATIVGPEIRWPQVFAAGDTDGDGADELAVLARSQDGTVPVVYVLRGPFVGDLDLFAAAEQVEWPTFDGYEARVVPAGDVNGDGFGDLLLASEIVYHNTISITTGPSFETQHLITEVGWDLGGLAGVGDQDGDGMDDIAFGLNYTILGDWGYMAEAYGAVVVVSRPDLRTVDSSNLPPAEAPGVRALTEGLHNSFGWLVAGGPDVTGDGVGDLVVAAPARRREGEGDIDRGAVLVYSDSDEPVARLVHDAGSDAALYGGAYGVGGSLSLVGDTNGDGFEDLVVSGPSAWLVLGPVEGTRPLCDTQYTGMRLEGVGDATGDGLGDLLFGGSWFARGGQ